MWLINCQELTLVEVGGALDVQYAILSHTWEAGEEVQFDEFQSRTATTKRGWDKIRTLCRLAIDEGYQYAWCDTCCINKTSSAELSEAINSMFSWYATAGICYVYLDDYDSVFATSKLGASRWFTRGWTLQELIAPARLRFYDVAWRAVGLKTAMSKGLSKITGIAEDILLVAKDRDLDDVLSQVSVAARMSWAARRETTRVEDIAYCLLGIFGVNLPLLYGEGERAFIRLQEEIVKTNNDLSLFAWRSAEDSSSGPLESYRGVFADHPRDFQYSGGIITTSSTMYNSEFTMSNKGVKLEMNLSYFDEKGLHVLFLNCHDTAKHQKSLGIFLIHQGASIFARARPQLFALRYIHGSHMIERKPFFLSKTLSPSIARSLNKVHRRAFIVSKLRGKYGRDWSEGDVGPKALWDGGQRMFITAGLEDFVGYYQYQIFFPNEFQTNTSGLKVFFGYGYGFEPWLRAVTLDKNYPLLHAVEIGDMRLLAQEAQKIKPRRKFDTGYGITVELVHGTRDGEPVFLINFEEKK
ncbi:heterokaryon incompatibility protein-domain-containing protein [Xylaria bambusicola]|uniref:heterokaryon incompatibility protein-domain-containing protein n=1 Tax=Xylaria bambusicola TaxID=326684 RepID=UPI00200824DA|nr:heterokaryon incompatibility protein-domain-containing protein [Xylaria bambusicola]KAI0528125.1 heterokaryon incompatibility protein-domain-containing protein [Xylaria bambusicola]